MNKYQKFYIDATLEGLDQQFNLALQELEDIYKTYSKNEEELYNQLSRVLLEFDIKEEKLKLTSKEYKKLMQEAQTSIYDLVLEQETQTKKYVDEVLKDAVKNTYEYNSYLVNLGLEMIFNPLSDSRTKKIIYNAIKGTNWVERLGVNNKKLEQALKKHMQECYKGNISVNDIKRLIEKDFYLNRYNINRLVRTELARVQSEALEYLDGKAGVEKQLFIATLDSKTCKICQGYDGKLFDYDDKSKPVIPLHPNNRSVLVGVPGNDYKPPTRRDNENDNIIDYKTYKEWKKFFD